MLQVLEELREAFALQAQRFNDFVKQAAEALLNPAYSDQASEATSDPGPSDPAFETASSGAVSVVSKYARLKQAVSAHHVIPTLLAQEVKEEIASLAAFFLDSSL